MRSRNSTASLWLLAFTGAAFMTAVLAVTTPTALAQGKKSHSATNSASAQIKTPVDVNSADKKTLETLPGVGSTVADRIIQGRPYNNLEELGKVKGLSKAKVEQMKDDVTFGPPVTAKKEPSQGASTKKAKPQHNTNAPNTPMAPTGRTAGKLAAGEKININTASAEELDRLPGIGPTKAQAIIDYRNQNGNFKTIEEIENVKGIKEGEFSKLKDHIKVN